MFPRFGRDFFIRNGYLTFQDLDNDMCEDMTVEQGIERLGREVGHRA
jgi:hypothetical protein